MLRERWIHTGHVMCVCCYANSGGNREACWQFFLPSSYECLLLWRKLFAVHTPEHKHHKNPWGPQAGRAGNVFNFPLDCSAFYLTFIDSGDTGWCCPCFLFLLHIHKLVYSPTWELCSTTWALCWEIKGLLKGSLPVAVEGAVILITFFSDFPFCYGIQNQ